MTDRYQRGGSFPSRGKRLGDRNPHPIRDGLSECAEDVNQSI
jgi:hypothetical protein